ncbi:MAG: hypothetical protein WA146_10265 [Thiobacillus sp.]
MKWRRRGVDEASSKPWVSSSFLGAGATGWVGTVAAPVDLKLA